MVLDLIIVLIVALFTFLGYKQGLIKAVIKILAFFIALIITITLYKTVANLIINNTQIDENLQSKITEKIETTSLVKNMQMLPESIVSSGEETINEIAKTITQKIMYVATFIIMFFALKIILRLIAALADLITKLPIIKQFDKAGGTIYGFVKGIFLVIAIFAIISLMSPLISKEFIDMINNSFIASNLYNHNLLIKLVK